MFYLENNCPVCVDGILGFYKCSDNYTIVIMCEECNSVWLNPADIENKEPIYPRSPEFNIPELNVSMSGGGSGWAAYEDITRAGMGNFVSYDRKYEPD
jgi:hypothetical protein